MKLPNGYGSVAKLTGNRRRTYMVRITTGFTDVLHTRYILYVLYMCSYRLRFTVRFPSAQATKQTPCLPVRLGRAYRLLLHGYTY